MADEWAEFPAIEPNPFRKYAPQRAASSGLFDDLIPTPRPAPRFDPTQPYETISAPSGRQKYGFGFDDLPDAPWITGGGGAELPAAPWVKAQAAQPPPPLSGDMPVPSSPDAGAAYEQARDRWKATVERAKAQQPAQGDFLHPIKPTGTGLGAVLERISQYPRIALGQITDAGETLGKVASGEIDATDPRAIEAAANMAMVASPAGEFAGTGAQIARRAGSRSSIFEDRGAIGPGMPNPDYRPPVPDLKAPPPSVDELKAASRAGYQAPEVAAVQIRPQAVTDLGSTIESDLVGAGFREKTTPKTWAVINELEVPQGVQAVGVADLDTARKALGVIVKDGRDVTGGLTAEGAAAARAMSHIDDFLPNLKQADLLAGDADAANAILTEARGNWKSAKQAELAQTKMENARIQAASTYGGGNINNALRQAYRPLETNNYAKTANWSPEAQAALKDVVEGRLLRNAARDIGRVAPAGGLNFMMHLAGGVPTAVATGGASIIPQIALASGTYAAKKLGERGTRKAAQRLDALLRAESPLARSRTSAPPLQVPSTATNAATGAALAAETPADAERQLQESELEAYIQRKYPWARSATAFGP